MQSVKNPIRKSTNNFQLKNKAESEHNESICNGMQFSLTSVVNLDQDKGHKT